MDQDSCRQPGDGPLSGVHGTYGFLVERVGFLFFFFLYILRGRRPRPLVYSLCTITWHLPFGGTRDGLPVHAHMYACAIFDTLAGGRLGEATHLVSGPAQGRGVEHFGALKGRG